MNQTARSIFFVTVAIEVLIILGLCAYIASHSGKKISFAEISSDDIIADASSTLDYYYDLASEPAPATPAWLPYKPEYERNADSLNDRFDYAVPKPKGAYRIITLGDSWGFGMFVNTRDTYSERLEEQLNQALADRKIQCDDVTKFEVLNFGVGGYDITYMVERLRLRGMKYDPDLVIPIIKVDDFVLVNELFQSKLRSLYDAYGNLDAKTVNGVAVNPRQELSLQAEHELESEHSESDLNAYGARALLQLASFYRNPVLFFVYGQNLSHEQNGILQSYAAEHGGFIFDSSPRLRPDEKVPHDEHPNDIGHARFAQELFGYLMAQNVIPCETK